MGTQDERSGLGTSIVTRETENSEERKEDDKRKDTPTPKRLPSLL